MDRRDFLKTSSVASLGGAAALVPATGQASTALDDAPLTTPTAELTWAISDGFAAPLRTLHTITADIAAPFIDRVRRLGIALDGKPIADVADADIVLSAGSPHHVQTDALRAFEQVPTAEPVTAETVAAWLTGFGGAFHWRTAAEAVEMVPLPIAVLGSAVSDREAHSTPGALSLAPIDAARFGDDRYETPRSQPEHAAHVRGAMFAAYIKMDAWLMLSETKRAALEIAAEASLHASVADAHVFAAEVWPTITPETVVTANARESADQSRAFNAHLARISPEAMATHQTFERLLGRQQDARSSTQATS